MAQTKKKRRKKHRGTQGGGIDRRGRASGRPKTREEARAQAKRRSEFRREAAPTWGGAFKRGLLGSAVFFGLIVLLFGREIGEAALLSVVMLALYVPMGYYIDRFFYRRRRRQEIQAREAEKAERAGSKRRR